MDSVAFIINPHSSDGNYQSFLDQLKKKIHHPLYIVSQSVEDTKNYIRKHIDEVDIFVAVGGDGTISTVAKEIIYTDKILAIFPRGSGNGFSNENNSPQNLDELLDRAKRKDFKKIDTFTVNSNFSINVSGAGFDGKVIQEFEKTKRGFANYIKVTINTFFGFKSIDIKFEDQYQSYDGEYLMINIANSRQFGNYAYIAPHASMSDGLVDIVLVKKIPIWYSPLFGLLMFTKGLKESKYIKYFTASEIEFSVNTDLWHLDGEAKKIISPIKIKVLPQSLKVLI